MLETIVPLDPDNDVVDFDVEIVHDFDECFFEIALIFAVIFFAFIELIGEIFDIVFDEG